MCFSMGRRFSGLNHSISLSRLSQVIWRLANCRFFSSICSINVSLESSPWRYFAR